MFEFIQAISLSFAALFPVVNPLGSAILFLSLTAGASAAVNKRLAEKVAINTFLLLVVVLLSGTWILHFFGISVPIVQIGGGAVVAYIGWTLLNKPYNATQQDPKINSDKEAAEMAFFPLTMPITAGPGSIAVAITVGAHEMQPKVIDTFWAQLGSVIGIFLVSILVFLCYRYASRITHRLSASNIQVIVRLAAFINLCIGLEIIWHGIQGLLM